MTPNSPLGSLLPAQFPLPGDLIDLNFFYINYLLQETLRTGHDGEAMTPGCKHSINHTQFLPLSLFRSERRMFCLGIELVLQSRRGAQPRQAAVGTVPSLSTGSLRLKYTRGRSVGGGEATARSFE